MEANEFRKMAYSAPEVPSMVFSAALTIEAKLVSKSSVGGCDERLARTASAPRFRPTPQSPSPTMLSYLVTNGSAAMTLIRPAVKAFVN